MPSRSGEEAAASFLPCRNSWLCRAVSPAAAAVPAQFARAFATGYGLLSLDPPFAIPVPEIKLYWHSRHNKNPAHRWLRQQVLEVCAPIAAL